jgi:hypothetical protein
MRIAGLLLAAGLSGYAFGPAAPAPAKASTLTVTISGPTSIRPGEQCLFTAYVSGGSGPYTYTWSTAHGDYEQASGDSFLAGADHEFQMRVDVDVTGANNASGSESLYVDLDSGAASCM